MMDQMQARLCECEQRNRALVRLVGELRAAVAALTAERDVARAEADRARRLANALIRPVPADADRPLSDPEPPTGVHSLSGLPAHWMNEGR
ncbi:hypothetical protein [Actinomadura macrotermitis]|uniref:Uncharacterized protein n=1 Tax=Actinomadura macrotermitis TaxID=2585200 RepID=A0A7K0C7I7_9ACTN|nr:hypothetical protein [Actinomadura macrotermitis]MQY09429.1 hypothetical protein [Actinomadura macrotermitis]